MIPRYSRPRMTAIWDPEKKVVVEPMLFKG